MSIEYQYQWHFVILAGIPPKKSRFSYLKLYGISMHGNLHVEFTCSNNKM